MYHGVPLSVPVSRLKELIVGGACTAGDTSINDPITPMTMTGGNNSSNGVTGLKLSRLTDKHLIELAARLSALSYQPHTICTSSGCDNIASVVKKKKYHIG